MTWLRPPDDAGVVYEFFSPFAHVPGKWEWCRIRSPTHGCFDTFIALGASTAEPATVVVNTLEGAAFLRDRYPQCRAVRVPVFDLRIEERSHGREVWGRLKASAGPVREADMTLTALPQATPRQVPYGGQGQKVWGSALTCWGVDLVLDAEARGFLRHEDGRVEELRGVPAVVTLGSFGRLAPLPPAPPGAAPAADPDASP